MLENQKIIWLSKKNFGQKGPPLCLKFGLKLHFCHAFSSSKNEFYSKIYKVIQSCYLLQSCYPRLDELNEILFCPIANVKQNLRMILLHVHLCTHGKKWVNPFLPAIRGMRNFKSRRPKVSPNFLRIPTRPRMQDLEPKLFSLNRLGVRGTLE